MYEKVIRDSVHGDIIFDDEIFIEIINTPEFQRLRRILQLGGAGAAYPSATHTRFSHSIGVYHVVGLFVDSQAFDEHATDKEKVLVKLAGLMHDLGHGAFSHTFEKLTTQSHEQYTRDIISNPNGNISNILNKYGYNPKDVCDIIEGTYKNNLINLLVSSQLDADRLDYLMRDSYNCGVDYAALDIHWIVRHIKIIDNKIAFSYKAINAIESYLLGRYHMYKQVYNHKLSTAFDSMFFDWYKRLQFLHNQNHEFFDQQINSIFKEIFDEKIIPIDKYLLIDDYLMFSVFKNCMNDSDQILADLSNRLVNRKFFAIRNESEIDVKEIEEKIKNSKYDKKYYLLTSEQKRLNIYTDGEIDGKDETIYIEKNGKIQPLSKVSMFIESIKTINKNKNEKKYLFPKDLV